MSAKKSSGMAPIQLLHRVASNSPICSDLKSFNRSVANQFINLGALDAQKFRDFADGQKKGLFI